MILIQFISIVWALFSAYLSFVVVFYVPICFFFNHSLLVPSVSTDEHIIYVTVTEYWYLFLSWLCNSTPSIQFLLKSGWTWRSWKWRHSWTPIYSSVNVKKRQVIIKLHPDWRWLKNHLLAPFKQTQSKPQNSL